MAENMKIEEDVQPTSATHRAMRELKKRVEGDESLDAELKSALLEDLSSDDPAELGKFVAALGARGKE